MSLRELRHALAHPIPVLLGGEVGGVEGYDVTGGDEVCHALHGEVRAVAEILRADPHLSIVDACGVQRADSRCGGYGGGLQDICANIVPEGGDCRTDASDQRLQFKLREYAALDGQGLQFRVLLRARCWMHGEHGTHTRLCADEEVRLQRGDFLLVAVILRIIRIGLEFLEGEVPDADVPGDLRVVVRGRVSVRVLQLGADDLVVEADPHAVAGTLRDGDAGREAELRVAHEAAQDVPAAEAVEDVRRAVAVDGVVVGVVEGLDVQRDVRGDGHGDDHAAVVAEGRDAPLLLLEDVLASGGVLHALVDHRVGGAVEEFELHRRDGGILVVGEHRVHADDHVLVPLVALLQDEGEGLRELVVLRVEREGQDVRYGEILAVLQGHLTAVDAHLRACHVGGVGVVDENLVRVREGDGVVGEAEHGVGRAGDGKGGAERLAG